MHNEREVKRRAQSGWHATNPALIPTVVKKPERNWAALSAAALKPAIGYWEDAPSGMKFGEPPVKPVVRCIPRKPAAPTTPPPQPCGDGAVWPRIFCNDKRDEWFVFDGPPPHAGMFYSKFFRATCAPRNTVAALATGKCPYNDMPVMRGDLAGLLAFLAEHHAEVAAQLRGKAATQPRDDVATGARV